MPRLSDSVPLLGRGFRPFFLLGAAYAVIALLGWLSAWLGGSSHGGFSPVIFHGHEMIFGFTMAIVAGFLLTAVASWTSWSPVRGWHLAGLAGLWIAGRTAVWTGEAMFIDLAFIPALAISLGVPLFKARNKRNFLFLGLLTALFAADLAIHFGHAGHARQGLYAATLLIIAMISIIGGRIIPAFTVAAMRRRGIELRATLQPRADMLALASLALVIASQLFLSPLSPVSGALALASGVIHAWRMRHFHVRHSLSDPMLWSLQIGYAWVVVGLALTGLAGFGIIGASTALHALTAGAIGGMTLAMMARVARGHTGRALTAGSTTTIALILVNLGALARVFGPLVEPAMTQDWILGSGIAWAAAFAIYLMRHTAMLMRRRPDGQPA